MKKFDGINDSVLFELWKCKDPDAETEFIERYRKYSVGLACSLLEDFGNVSTSEKDDLVSIGLFSLFVALEKFRGDGNKFYPYWRRIATNRMMDDIKANSFSYMVRETNRRRPFVRYDDDATMAMGFESSGINEDEEFLKEDLITTLTNLKISSREQSMFLLYVAGYSLNELALLFDTTYSKARRQIEAIKAKLKEYFV